MTESDLITLFRQLQREVVGLSMGKIEATASASRTSAKRFSSEGAVKNLRLIRPFGVASRPPAGTETLIGAIGGNPSHLTSLGDFDADAPAFLQDGEACLYGADGQVVYMKTGGKVLIGSDAASEPAVLGNVLAAGLAALVNAFLDATQIGIGPTGPVFLDPAVRAALVSFTSTYLTTAGTNVLAQKTFVERGA
jgi:phage gp45-like